jgi:hypothetical protein
VVFDLSSVWPCGRVLSRPGHGQRHRKGGNIVRSGGFFVFLEKIGLIHRPSSVSNPFNYCSSFYYLLKKLETLLISLVYRTLKGVNDCIKGCK